MHAALWDPGLFKVGSANLHRLILIRNLLVAAQVRIQSHISQCVMCDGQHWAKADLQPNTSGFLLSNSATEEL
jgi:hypothetical protein